MPGGLRDEQAYCPSELIAQLREDADKLVKRYEQLPRTPEVKARLERFHDYDAEDCHCPYCWDKNKHYKVKNVDGDEARDAYRCSECGREWRFPL